MDLDKYDEIIYEIDTNTKIIIIKKVIVIEEEIDDQDGSKYEFDYDAYRKKYGIYERGKSIDSKNKSQDLDDLSNMSAGGQKRHSPSHLMSFVALTTTVAIAVIIAGNNEIKLPVYDSV